MAQLLDGDSVASSNSLLELFSVPPTQAATDNDDITDDEFEALLDQLHGDTAPGAQAPSATPAAESDDITEEEFEALLDELQGKKKTSVPAVDSKSAPATKKPSPSPVKAKVADKPTPKPARFRSLP